MVALVDQLALRGTGAFTAPAVAENPKVPSNLDTSQVLTALLTALFPPSLHNRSEATRKVKGRRRRKTQAASHQRRKISK